MQRQPQADPKAAQRAMAHLQVATLHLHTQLYVFQGGALGLAVSAVQVLGQFFQLGIWAAAVIFNINIQKFRFHLKPQLDQTILHFFHAVVICVLEQGL